MAVSELECITLLLYYFWVTFTKITTEVDLNIIKPIARPVSDSLSELPTLSHGDSYLFYVVANSYELTRTI